MTTLVEAFGWILVVGGFVLIKQEGGLGMGACGAMLLGMAYAGAFQ